MARTSRETRTIRPVARRRPAKPAAERPASRRRRPAGETPYHHGDLHDALLAAAERVLERDGLAGLTLRAVAREAGVSHAAPTHHFGDLTGLLSELAAIGFRRFNEAMAAAGRNETHSLMKALARAKAYVAYAQARPGMYGLMFRTERLDMTRPSLHEAATASFEGLANAVSLHPQREAYRRGAGSTVARPGRGHCADVVAGARLHHAAARWTAEGYFAPAAGGHQRRPTATRDAALDRRAAADAVGQRFGGEFVSVGMDLRGERYLWRAAQQPLQILVCRASLASASRSSLGCRVQSSYRALASAWGAAPFSGPRMIS